MICKLEIIIFWETDVMQKKNNANFGHFLKVPIEIFYFDFRIFQNYSYDIFGEIHKFKKNPLIIFL